MACPCSRCRESRTTAYTVALDTDRALDQMIQAAELQCVGDQIPAENFPHHDVGRVAAIELHGFGRTLTTEAALHELHRCGRRPATASELVALAAANMDLPDEFIVALGSTWDAPDRRSYVIFYVPRTRRLVPCSRNCGWVSGSLYACVAQRASDK
jgi:hypothetical protein